MLFNCLACLCSDLQEMVDVVDHHQLFVKIEKAFPECDEEGCLKIYENVLRCVGNKQYVCYLLFRQCHDKCFSLLSSTIFGYQFYTVSQRKILLYNTTLGEYCLCANSFLL